jgi:hypothetical protein
MRYLERPEDLLPAGTHIHQVDVLFHELSAVEIAASVEEHRARSVEAINQVAAELVGRQNPRVQGQLRDRIRGGHRKFIRRESDVRGQRRRTKRQQTDRDSHSRERRTVQSHVDGAQPYRIRKRGPQTSHAFERRPDRPVRQRQNRKRQQRERARRPQRGYEEYRTQQEVRKVAPHQRQGPAYRRQSYHRDHLPRASDMKVEALKFGDAVE